jgi:hypothetical protein
MIVLNFKRHEMYRKVCCVEEREYDPQKTENLLECLYKIIDCRFVDVVRLGHGIDMFVDDEGLFNHNRYDLNHLATYLRTKSNLESKNSLFPAGYPPVMGVAVLLSSDEEGNTIDLTPEQVAYVKEALHLPNPAIE